MKHFLFLTLLLPSLIFGMHHKTNPIIFYLDLDVAEGKSEGVDEFVDYLVAAVKETEPKTMYYKYWISEDKKKVSLIEMYHSNEDAIFHMNAFAEAPHRDKFLETFIVTNFQVLGDTNAELKDVMAEYTRDHRKLINGFKRKK
jgi:disulfide oxidoreductase YuzD